MVLRQANRHEAGFVQMTLIEQRSSRVSIVCMSPIQTRRLPDQPDGATEEKLGPVGRTVEQSRGLAAYEHDYNDDDQDQDDCADANEHGLDMPTSGHALILGCETVVSFVPAYRYVEGGQLSAVPLLDGNRAALQDFDTTSRTDFRIKTPPHGDRPLGPRRSSPARRP
jgi:hypothetical protein